ALLVAADTTVVTDQPLMVMEAMKMEHTIKAPFDGQLLEFYYQPGDLVDGGAELLHLQASESDD
ncbi:MAG: 3-methylcrotonyl-CoA carboxylase alpha subunit, partial [Paraglaciecola psychrophila]